MVGWAVFTYHARPNHLEAMRRRGMHVDFSGDRAPLHLRAAVPRGVSRAVGARVRGRVMPLCGIGCRDRAACGRHFSERRGRRV